MTIFFRRLVTLGILMAAFAAMQSRASSDTNPQDQMEQAAACLRDARRITLFGQGHAAPLVALSERRLMRSGYQARGLRHSDWEAPAVMLSLQAGDALVAFAFRPLRARDNPSPAPLRLTLESRTAGSGGRQVELRLLKCRGALPPAGGPMTVVLRWTLIAGVALVAALAVEWTLRRLLPVAAHVRDRAARPSHARRPAGGSPTARAAA